MSYSISNFLGSAYSATELTPLIEHWMVTRAPWVPGYRVKIIDGNCIAASERGSRRCANVQAGALPGKSLVVLEPAPGLVTEVFPCEDGHAQERSLFGAVLETVHADDLWMADRNFCTRGLLCGIDTRGAFFIVRQHEGLPYEMLQCVAVCRTRGDGARGGTTDPGLGCAGHRPCVPASAVKLDQPTRDGDHLLYIVTNVPRASGLDQTGRPVYRIGGWWREATYNTPIQTTASYPIIGLTGLLNLVTVVDKFRPQAVEEKGSVCRPPSSPPPLGHSELIQLWMRLPAANRQRLLWLLSQLLEHQLSAAAAPGEDSDESAPRH